MISTYKYNEITWVDLENPTQDEVRQIADKYGLNPATANDLLTPSSRPIIDEHTDYTYLIFHFPITSNRENYGKITEIQEIDFILGKNFIITNRYMAVDSLIEFSKTFTVKSNTNKGPDEHAGYIFYNLISALYEELTNRLEHVNDLLRDSEERIFKGEEKEMVIELSKLNRLLLHFKKSVSIHDEIIKELIEVGENIYGTNFRRYLRGIYGEYVKTSAMIQSSKEYLDELRETNDSLLTTKQNEIMKNLTIMAFVAFPLTIISAVFGMNTKNMPFIGSEHDFLIVTGIMIAAVCVIFVYFKYRKWL
jgi:magnesium transporter